MATERKSLFASKTVAAAVVFAGAFVGARLFHATEDVIYGIVVVGIAAVAIFMRKGLIQVLDTPVGEDDGVDKYKYSKPLHRSMTVVSALTLVAAYFIARYHYEVSADTLQIIVVVGCAITAIYLRRGMLNALNPQKEG